MGADFHFRTKVPEARLDDYIENQDKLINWLKNYEKDHLILTAGDLVDQPRERSDALGFANYLIKSLPKIYGVLGNHDLLFHSLEAVNIDKTTMGNLINCGKFVPITEMEVENVKIFGYHYGQEIQHVRKKTHQDKVQIAVYHGMVMEESNPFFDGHIALDLLKEFPEYDIILTGDNHQGFIVEYESRVLINPGSLKRDTAAQIEHVPCVYSFDTNTLKLERIKVPTDNDIISREHLEIEKERDQRIEQLSSKFKEVEGATLEFDKNVYDFLNVNKVRDSVDGYIMKWLSIE